MRTKREDEKEKSATPDVAASIFLFGVRKPVVFFWLLLLLIPILIVVVKSFFCVLFWVIVVIGGRQLLMELYQYCQHERKLRKQPVVEPQQTINLNHYNPPTPEKGLVIESE